MGQEDQKVDQNKHMYKGAFGVMMKGTLEESVKISPKYYNKVSSFGKKAKLL